MAEFEFPIIEGVEWDFALSNMKDEESLLETIGDFCDLNEVEALTLERLMERCLDKNAEGLSDFRIKVHAMKSSTALIGAKKISGMAYELERASAEKDIRQMQEKLPGFLKEWRNLKQKMKVLFKEEEHGKKEVDYYKLLEYLRLLNNAITAMDIDTADELIKCIREYQYPEEEEKIVEELALAVRGIDPKKIAALAEQLEEIFAERIL